MKLQQFCFLHVHLRIVVKCCFSFELSMITSFLVWERFDSISRWLALMHAFILSAVLFRLIVIMFVPRIPSRSNENDPCDCGLSDSWMYCRTVIGCGSESAVSCGLSSRNLLSVLVHPHLSPDFSNPSKSPNLPNSAKKPKVLRFWFLEVISSFHSICMQILFLQQQCLISVI